MITPFLVSAAVLAAAFRVDGETSCPQPADVAARFAQLAPTSGAGHRASLTQAATTAVDVRLFDEHDVLIAERRLEAATCKGLLEATAATLFAWEATLPARSEPPPNARSPLPAGSDGVVSEPEPSPSWLAWRVDVAALGALSGTSIRPGLSAALAIGPRGALWLARAQLKAAWPFSASLSGGRVEWIRPSASLGAALRLFDGGVHVEAQLTFEAGLVSARGVGFEDNRRASAFDPAIGLCAHVSREVSSRLQVFGELAASVYLFAQVAQVGGVLVNLQLPPLTLELRVGVAWGS